MNQRKALGKGLDALLPTTDTPLQRNALMHIPIEKIRPNSYQPRVRFQPERLDELAASISENGVLQPIVVRPSDDGFELVAGERRWRAAQRAGLHRVPALVHSVADQEMIQLALVENVQREDLSAIEEAHAYKLLIEEFGMTQEQVAAKVARSRTAVTNTLRLLKLPKELQEKVLDGALSMGHARALLPLERPDQIRLAQDIVAQGLSVRQTERRVQKLLKPPPPLGARAKDPNLLQAEERLEERWQTKIEIRSRSRSSGRVLIYFNGHEELQRIYTQLMGEE